MWNRQRILTLSSVCMALVHITTALEKQSGPVLGEVFDLTDLNFDQFVNSSTTSPPWLIEIYAPWCPACKDLEPVWQRLAADLGPSGILMGKVSSIYSL